MKSFARISVLVIVILGFGALGWVGASLRPDKAPAAVPALPAQPYVAQTPRTQLYRSGVKGDATLYRVVDMPRENLRCVMLVGDGRFGRGVSCLPLNTLEGR
jgi:hypothetical protein